MKVVTIHLMLTIVVNRGWHLSQLDIGNAFSNGLDIEGMHYYEAAPRVHHSSSSLKGFVSSRKWYVYGLKQSFRIWFRHLWDFLVSIGFVPSLVDQSLFVLTQTHVMYILVYVNDIVVTSSNEASVG